MKRIISVLLTVATILGCVFALASCGGASTYPKIEKAFVKEGWEVSTALDTATKEIKEELEADDLAVEIHLLVKKDITDLGTAIIVEFKSTKEFKKALEESKALAGMVEDVKENEDVKEFYNALVEKGLANGNCFLIPILNGDDAMDIVKGA